MVTVRLGLLRTNHTRQHVRSVAHLIEDKLEHWLVRQRRTFLGTVYGPEHNWCVH